MLLYLTLFTIAVAGMSHLPWWVVIPGIAMVSYILIDDRRLASSLPRGQRLQLISAASAVSIVNATAAVILSFGAGQISAWLWGI